MTDNSALLEEADRIEADMRSITLVAGVDVAGLISHLAAAIRSLEAEREGWRDIASAPEGVEVLVYGDWLNSAETMPEWRPAPRAGIAYKSGSRSEPSSWCGESAGAHDEYIWWQPSGWRPLPTPPTAKTEEG